MLTIFSTPKPFRGHIGVIQRNAIESWKHIHPDVDVILFGDDEGTAQAASKFGARFEAEVPRNEFRTPYLNWIFDRAQEIARFEILCYVNCDIVLTSDFKQALDRVTHWNREFLMVGRRWDTDVTEMLDFPESGWEARIRGRALAANFQRPAEFIDYFVFRRGLFSGAVPPFAVGRPGFDNWLIWFAIASRVPVIDVSGIVIAVHQNHDHSHVAPTEEGFWHGAEAKQNAQFLDVGRRFATIGDATHRLSRSGIHANHYRWIVRGRRLIKGATSKARFAVLDLTRPIRRVIGLRQKKSATTQVED